MDNGTDIRMEISAKRRRRGAIERQRPVVLACDTSTNVGSVALVEGGQVTAETIVNSATSHSLRILKDVETMLALRGIAPADVDAFVTAGGPGSFTGVRIAMSTMKGLAWSVKKPLISIGSLHVLARPLLGRDSPVLVALDAKRHEVYAALFASDGTVLMAPGAMPPADAAARAAGPAAQGMPVICAGEGITAYADVFAAAIGPRMIRAAAWEDFIRAGVLGVMGTAMLAAGEFADVDAVEPVYLRRSEAEINLENRSKNAG